MSQKNTPFFSNVTVEDGFLVFGGTVASTGGVAKAPLALGRMKTSTTSQQQQRSPSPSSMMSGGKQQEPMALSLGTMGSSSGASLPARATLRVVPQRASSATGGRQTPIKSQSELIAQANRDEAIDSLLAKSRAAAPTPADFSSSSTASASAANQSQNLGGGGRRSATPSSFLSNTSNINQSAGTSPQQQQQSRTGMMNQSGSPSPETTTTHHRYLGERGVIEASDFDVTTDEIRPLGSVIVPGSSAEAGGGRSPGGTNAAADTTTSSGTDDASRISTAAGRPLHVPFAPTIRSRTGVVDIMSPLCLRDYIVLAEACQRAGRARVEGTAYFKIAHLLSGDEEQKPKAAVYLRKYLQICRRINDLQGEAKALNALGIIHYEMALQSAVSGSQQSQMLLRIALGFHRQHAEIADAAGIFIANTNAGLCHSKLGDHVAAAEAHKLAASFAVQAGDRDAEALALSNLSASATNTGDLATSRLCAQRQLDVGNATHNSGVSCEAHEQLAQLAIQRSDYTSATSHLVSSLEIALREGDQKRALRLRCQLGVAGAAGTFEGKVGEVSASMEGNATAAAAAHARG